MTAENLIQGPLVMQSPEVVSLAHILCHAASDLYDAAALHDRGWMWEEARAIASRILAACPMD